ncbi:hypothetical protein AB0G42_21620 [Streptomyces yangpuensis]|uniref:hypothetical protein n=1 Tax=Streptomyces yangpuensis TaxID=1648182 RepID=UPI0034330C63
MSRTINSGGYLPIIVVVVETCGVCVALGAEWDDRRDRDVLLEIANHPHAEPKLARVEEWISDGVQVCPEEVTAP